jgi:hypothetical protein
VIWIQKHVVVCVLLAWGCLPVAAEEIIAIKADRIDTVASGVVENGVLIIRGGKISAIGAGLEIPRAATVIDARDKTVFPGLVNPFSRLGLSAPPQGKVASNPHYRVLDELYPFQDDYPRVLQAGFTTLALVPGGRGIAGQSALIRPFGRTGKEMLVTESGPLVVNFEAEEKAKKVIKDAFESAAKEKDSTDPKVKPLVKAVQGRIPVLVQCGQPGETLHLLPLLKPYEKMKWALVAGAENYRLAETLAKAKVPVILPAQIVFEQFTRNRLNAPQILADAGVKVACTPGDDSMEGYENFLLAMAQLVKYGLDKDTAKKSMTLYPAQMLGLDYRLGSLEVGKDANVLVLSADPLEAGARIHEVVLEGKSVYRAP